MTDGEHHTPSGALPLPRQTTPTWEIELLISGATVFSLVQLPAKVDAGFIMAINRAAHDIATLMVPVWIYVQSALVILIGTFILHLCLRAYWVALVGLDSVSPGGVKWSSFKRAGPYQLQTSREGREDMRALIEIADNRASRLFGVGVGLALGLVIPTILAALAIFVTLLTRPLSGLVNDAPMFAFLGLFAIVFLPWTIALLLDHKFGARWPPSSRGGRFLLAVLGFYARLGLGRASNMPMALYITNTVGHRGNIVIVVASIVIMVGVSTKVISHVIDWSPSDIKGLPQLSADSRDVLLPRHYASMSARDPSFRPIPYIADPIVRGPYLKLFVPYRVTPHNRALEKHCDIAGEDASDTGRTSRAMLDCFARLHDVRVNGNAVANVHFDASEDPVSRVRGMIAMIPVSSLAAGRHELTLLPMPRENEEAQSKPREPYWIPFWR